jgi:hypothetical protein
VIVLLSIPLSLVSVELAAFSWVLTAVADPVLRRIATAEERRGRAAGAAVHGEAAGHASATTEALEEEAHPPLRLPGGCAWEPQGRVRHRHGNSGARLGVEEGESPDAAPHPYPGGQRRMHHRLAALAPVSLVALLIAGCGGTAGAGSAHATLFVSVHAVRTSAFPNNHIPAFDHTGTNAPAIAQLYDAIAALKPYPAGASYSCPIDLGLLYHLTFTRADGSRVAGLAKPDGCAYASLNGGPSGRLADPTTFWSLFAAALGVPASALQYQP